MAKILIIGALAESLYNFRGDLLRSLMLKGHEVLVMAGHTDNYTRKRIEKHGVTFISYPVQRNGVNPRFDLTTFFSLRSTLIIINPDIVLAYTIKPVIWGGLAIGTLRKKIRFYALITGLGLSFQPGGFKQKALSALVTNLYRIALYKAERVIFQNRDNMREFVDRKIVRSQKCVVVNGSGVNISYFNVQGLPQGPVVFLTIARLLGDKGLRVYAQAAAIVKSKYPDVVFNIVGPIDPSPDGISIEEVESWQVSGAINYLGSTSDVRPFIVNCHVYVLASFHEGLPRTVLEAMSMGRPILTTDVPGCRETVLPGKNGYLVPVNNIMALVDRMIWFVNNSKELTYMGMKSRKIAEKRFDVNIINEKMLSIMGLS